MLSIKNIGIVIGGSLFCASLFANWWLFKEAKDLQGTLSLSRANEAVMLTALESFKRQSEEADAATKKYVLSIQKLRKERDKLFTEMQSAKKNDSQYREWSATVLPSFIINKYNGVYGKSDSTTGNKSDKSPASTSD